MIHKLTDREVKAASPSVDHKTGKPKKTTLGDGGGLSLVVTPGREGFSKKWLFRYTSPTGKRRDMGLGTYPTVSLAKARKKAQEAREKLSEGVDPLEEKKREERPIPTFQEAALDYFASRKMGWSTRHSKLWIASLRNHAFPVIGPLPVDKLTIGDILQVLKPIWETKTDTASRVRQRIEKVLDRCTVLKLRDGSNPARWRGNLEAILPAKGQVTSVKHFEALPYKELPAFMARLREKQGMGARALEFLILTAARSGEVRGATWDEIDLESKVWTIPAGRMKTKKEHRVPLCKEAVELLQEIPRIKDNPLVFWSPVTNAQLSDNTLRKVLLDMGVSAKPHGFRSTFRDWCSEITSTPREVAEAALSHVVGNQVEAAYRRGDLFNKRHKVMERWGRYCYGYGKGSKVVPMPGTGA